ncbi:MAG TPA: prenyltransferase/squalene oxidase repeat-containing protein [Phycisphaerae bacterium]|jgi:hypothetical protein
MRRCTAGLLLLLLASPARADDLPPPANVPAAMQKAVEFLLKNQNPDGSWGAATDALHTFGDDWPIWANPETQRCWKVATTGLCLMALLDDPGVPSATVQEAADRGLRFLLARAEVKRPSDWDTMNSWAYIYGLQGLATAYGAPRYADSEQRAALRDLGQRVITRLAECQSPRGGWGYLEFDVPRTPRHQWATSFTTAAALVALLDARQHGFAVDEGLIERAALGVQRCRLPSGAYTYSIPVIPTPGRADWIDQIKGSLSRIQCCNLALLLAGKDVSNETLATGLDHFFREHKFLDIARNKPIPHEAYYKNSGYFYLFGHYYAARVIERLPPGDQGRYWPQLQHEIIKIQQPDGSLWDYDMQAYHKAYGTAFALLALEASVHPGSATPAPHPAAAASPTGSGS